MTTSKERTVRITSAAAAQYALYLVGDQESVPDSTMQNGTLNPMKFRLRRIALAAAQWDGAAGGAPVDLTLAQPLELAQDLFSDDNGVLKLATATQLNQKLQAVSADIRERWLKQLEEAQRRMGALDLDLKGGVFLGLDSPFGDIGAFAGAKVRLALWTIVGQGIIVGLNVACSAYAKLSYAPGGDRSFGLTCTLSDALGATLRVDADDLQLRLPEFALPTLDLFNAQPLRLAATTNWSASELFEKLYSQVNVTIDRPLELALRRREHGSPGIDWALVDASFNPATDWSKLPLPLAKFNVTLSVAGGGGQLSINNVWLARIENRCEFNAEVQPLTLGRVALGDGSRQAGPLQISWSDVGVTPVILPGNIDGGVLSLRVDFARLQLQVMGDPDAVLAFRGAVIMTSSGIKIDKTVPFELIQPYPIKLIVAATDELARSAGAVLRLVFELAGEAAHKVAHILQILARIAVAAGRAAVFVANISLGVLQAMGEALVAVGELLGRAFEQLAKLAESGDANLAVELRIGTSPLELRQVLVSLRQGSESAARTLDLIGLRLGISGGWRPGVLIDLATAPGAYLVLERQTAASPSSLATLSTDLWLQSDSGLSAMRDAVPPADSKPGSEPQWRPDEPLIKLALNAAPGMGDFMLVLGGLSRSRLVLFKRFAGGLSGAPGDPLRTLVRPYSLVDLSDQDVKLEVNVNTDRILPLLGMGDPAANTPTETGSATPIDRFKQAFGNVVWIKKHTCSADLKERKATVNLELGMKMSGIETKASLDAILSLDTLQLRMDLKEGAFPISSKRIEERAMGLVWIIEQADPVQRKDDESIVMFNMGFAGAQSGLELNRPSSPSDLTGKARMLLCFDGLASDGQGIVFEVTEFKVGPSGLDLTARVVRDKPVRLNGIDVAFQFSDGELQIKAGKLVHASVEGHGSLPPALIGNVKCQLALAFGSDNDDNVVLQSGKVRLLESGEGIKCQAMRFTLNITDLDIGIVRDVGYHFFFLVTGSLRFTPADGEFDSGLLQYLSDIEMVLERTPLAADARVLAKHISFQKTLNPKKSFNLFNLFTFELRGFGYHPSSDKFDGAAAVNISGQVNFLEFGDVKQPSITFHGLWLALPAPGESLPRIKADGLAVDLNLKGAIRVKGEVIAVDKDTRTVEGVEYAPTGYDMSGFLGTGELSIPGFGDLAANLGFVELRSQTNPTEYKKAFYFYAEKRRMAVEITTPIWVFYLREFGFGFGYRYTLEALDAADKAGESIPKLIAALDDVSTRQGDLHKISAWRPSPEGDRVTLALKGAMQTYPAQKVYDEVEEEKAQNLFFFDLVAAIRTDFTLFMGLRGWLGTNYHDYQKNTDGLRTNPGLRGYLYISAPRKQLLARAIGSSQGYIGERIAAFASGSPEPALRRALRSVDWSATLFIKPGLFHYELGWPDQLVVRLVDTDNMKVSVRGGMIFRVAEDGLLWAYNIEAQGFFRFGGQAQIGPVGVKALAVLDVRFIARILAFLSWRFSGSMMYGLISLDATLNVSFSAWMKVNLGFTSFTLRIGFERSLQLSAAVEAVISPEGMGARVDARVAISVFGRNLSVSIGFDLNPGRLAEARARVQRFLAMSITTDTPDSIPAVAVKAGDQTLGSDANTAASQQTAPVQEESTDRKSISHADQGGELQKTDYWLVLRKAWVKPEGEVETGDGVYGMLVPKEAIASDASSFYAAPSRFYKPINAPYDYELRLNATELGSLKRWSYLKASPELVEFKAINGTHVEINTLWDIKVENDAQENRFKLGNLFDECFLYNAEWGSTGRVTTEWTEPPLRAFSHIHAASEQSEEARLEARDRAQRQHQAANLNNSIIDGVHQARSTVMAMFFEQFADLALSGPPKDPSSAHVIHSGLVFYGSEQAMQALQNASIITRGKAGGTVNLFNPRRTWFDRVDPVLALPPARKRKHGQGLVTEQGVKLAWELKLPALEDWSWHGLALEHFLDCYVITRSIDNAPASGSRLVKCVSTLGADSTGSVALHAPEFNFVDDLSDLPAMYRSALLPSHDEASAMAGAIAWAGLFQDRDHVTLTYSVAPRDTAGVCGDPKGFFVTVPRPLAPIRPAEAELRFVIKGLLDEAAIETGKAPSDKLAVVMALRDSSFASGSVDINGYKVTREYRLICDPEVIQPSGYFGAGGLTDRGASAPNGFLSNANQLQWAIKPGFVKVTEVEQRARLMALEADEDTFKKYPYWRALAGTTGLPLVDQFFGVASPGYLGLEFTVPDVTSPSFFDCLWRRIDKGGEATGPRVANRFWLVTVHRIMKDNVLYAEYTSRPTAVPIEIRVEAVKATDAVKPEPGLLRPDAFEWPIAFTAPPLTQGQVSATCGFACFNVPGSRQTFADLLSNSTLTPKLDPARRVLTTVSFEATPRFGAGDPHRVHRSTIAGYMLHELDIDDLARLDTEGKDFIVSRKTWARARPVAAIERISRDEAMLHPSDNRDWQGWQAHYPSETWRGESKGTGQGSPMQGPWFSAAESTLGFAPRNPRLRFFPTVPENGVQDLLQGGAPSELRVFLWAEPGSRAEQHLKNNPSDLGSLLCLVSLKTHLTDTGEVTPIGEHLAFTTTSEYMRITRCDHAPMAPSDVRVALLRLGWKPVEIAKTFRGNPTLLDGLSMTVNGMLGANIDLSTGIFKAPLVLKAFVHPLLEEVLGELEYSIDQDTLYRRYVVSAQSVQPLESQSIEQFLAALPAQKDPYGWAALHQLGLAATISVYDRDRGCFIDAAQLGYRIETAFNQAVERYWKTYAKDGEFNPVGQPFVDVLLRPGRNASPAPFDAHYDKGEDANRKGRVELADDGLAIMQMALRPVAVQGRAYWRVRDTLNGDWARPETPNVMFNDPNATSVETYELLFENSGTSAVDLMRVVDGVSWMVAPGARLQLPLPSDPRFGPRDRAQAQLDFLCRCDVELGAAPMKITLQSVVTTSKADPKATAQVRSMLAPAKQNQLELQWDLSTLQAPSLERFPPLDPQAWAALAMTAEEVAQQTLDPGLPRCNARVRDAFDTLSQNLRLTLPDINWAKGVAPFPGLRESMAGYQVWMQHVLDNGAHPLSSKSTSSVRFSVAAPIKAQPWRLADDHQGRVSLSFLHEDRWAHARAYAVRPTTRYQYVAASAGWLAQSDLEQLIPADNRALSIGYALAVAPRTERLEPPVIMGSRLLADKHIWQLVVARHGEEQLASSNRPLQARLAIEGMAWAFAREYRYPQWPERVMGDPSTDIYPKTPFTAGETPKAPSTIDSTALGVAATTYPALWQGADIYHIDRLLPHYRQIALGVARAGIVVSDVVSAVQDSTPRRDLVPRALGKLVERHTPEYKNGAQALLGYASNPPRISIHSGSFPAQVYLSGLRMISHADLVFDPDWVQSATAADVVWLPDPEISYYLVRRSRANEQNVDSEEVQVNLVPTATTGAGPAVAHYRGSQYFDNKSSPQIIRLAGNPTPDFFLEFSFGVCKSEVGGTPTVLPQRIRALDKPQARQLFKERSADCASLDTEYLFEVQANVAANADFTAIEAGAKSAEQAMTSYIGVYEKLWPELGVVLKTLEDYYADLAKHAVDMDVNVASLRAGLSRLHQITLVDSLGQGIHVATPVTSVTVSMTATGFDVLTLRSLPGDAAGIEQSHYPIASSAGGLFWKLCRQLLLGDASELVVRAVDARNAISKEEGGWVAPGEIEIDVELPSWVKWAE